MAYIYYTNPDGIIGTMEAGYNRDGSIRPAGSVSHRDSVTSKASKVSKAKKVKANKTTTNSSKQINNSTDKKSSTKQNVTQRQRKQEHRREVPRNNHKDDPEFVKDRIDKMIGTWTKCHFDVSKHQSTIERVRKGILISELEEYFKQKVEELASNNGWSKMPEITKTSTTVIENHVKRNKKKSKKGHSETSGIDALINCWNTAGNQIKTKSVVKAYRKIKTDSLREYYIDKLKMMSDFRFTERVDDIIKKLRKISGASTMSAKPKKKSPHPIVDRTFSKEKQRARNVEVVTLASVPEQIYVGSKRGRKPAYGYARDRFGRIQERDHYVENRPVNPHNSANSLFDSNDDHDSQYSEFE